MHLLQIFMRKVGFMEIDIVMKQNHFHAIYVFVFYRYTRLVLSNTDSSSKQTLENIHNGTYVFLSQTCWRTRTWGAFRTSAHISTNFVYQSYICVFFRLVAPNCILSLRKISVGLMSPFVRNLTTMLYTTLG